VATQVSLLFPTASDKFTVTFDVNLWYTTGDMAWIMASTALVWLMIPGVGFFYSGLARRKSALSLIWLSLMSIAIVSFQVPLNNLETLLTNLSGSSGAIHLHSPRRPTNSLET